MKNPGFQVFLICGLILMASCTPKQENIAPVLPLPTQKAFHDPDNNHFMQAVEEFILSRKAPNNTRYEFTRIDLNGDQRRDGIVLMKSPHQYWCGNNGCNMYVFMAANNHFEVISEIAPIRGPIIVSDRRTNGWRDMVVRVSGRENLKTKDVILKFDGRSYPPQPAFQPAAQNQPRNGVKIFP